PFFANRPNAHSAVLSATGQIVAYVVGNTQNFFYPSGNTLYWQDLQHGDTRSVAPGRIAFSPSLSGDGRLIAFQSADPGYQFVNGIGDANNTLDVFLRDMIAGTNQLISINALGTGAGNRTSSNAFFSP